MWKSCFALFNIFQLWAICLSRHYLAIYGTFIKMNNNYYTLQQQLQECYLDILLDILLGIFS
jgi:hypothetical protein